MMEWLRGALAVAVLTTGACGMFNDDEEPLEGERIPVRQVRTFGTVQPLPQPAPEVAPSTDEQIVQ